MRKRKRSLDLKTCLRKEGQEEKKREGAELKEERWQKQRCSMRGGCQYWEPNRRCARVNGWRDANETRSVKWDLKRGWLKRASRESTQNWHCPWPRGLKWKNERERGGRHVTKSNIRVAENEENVRRTLIKSYNSCAGGCWKGRIAERGTRILRWFQGQKESIWKYGKDSSSTDITAWRRILTWSFLDLREKGKNLWRFYIY